MSEDEKKTSATRRPRWRTQLQQLMKLWEAQAALGWGIIIVLGALVGTIYLVQASSVAEIGRRMQISQSQLAALKRDNGIIEQQIAESQSLDNLQERARAQGFVQANPDEIEYLVVPNVPAVAEDIDLQSLRPVESAPQPIKILTMQEAVWVWLQQQFTGLTRGEANQE